MNKILTIFIAVCCLCPLSAFSKKKHKKQTVRYTQPQTHKRARMGQVSGIMTNQKYDDNARFKALPKKLQNHLNKVHQYPPHHRRRSHQSTI